MTSGVGPVSHMKGLSPGLSTALWLSAHIFPCSAGTLGHVLPWEW